MSEQAAALMALLEIEDEDDVKRTHVLKYEGDPKREALVRELVAMSVTYATVDREEGVR